MSLGGDQAEILKSMSESHPRTFVETLVHVFPSSVFDSVARGDILQIVAFAVLFAMAVSAAGEKGEPIIRAAESLSQVMFKMTNLVMKFAPFGVGAAMAHTIASQGPQVLVSLGYLIFTFYFAIVVFVVVVIGTVMLIARVPVRQFIRAVREPAAIAFATTTSEAAMPKAMEAMERLGVPNRIVSFVMPTGYSFNLDGSMIFLAVASVFVAQAMRNDHRAAHELRPTDHDDADIHGDVERDCGRTAFFHSGAAGDTWAYPATEYRGDWRRDFVRR